MQDLSRRSGVPVATLKFWIQEGLVPRGTPTARNQARYDDRHLERVALVRALREGADLSIATLRRVLAVLDADPGAGDDAVAVAIDSLGPVDDVLDAGPGEDERDAGLAETTALVEELVARLGWDVEADGTAGRALARALAAVRRWMPGLVEEPAHLEPFATHLRQLAEVEIPDGYDPAGDPERSLAYAVLGTTLFEPVLLALRRLAHVDRSRELAGRRHDG